MNNFERQEMIDEIVDKYTARKLAGILIDADEALKITQDKLDEANEEISRISLDIALNLNKIKAEAVREFSNYLSCNTDSTIDFQDIANSFIRKMGSNNEQP